VNKNNLVQNECESQRIEEFAAQEPLKAQKLADLSLEHLPLGGPPRKKTSLDASLASIQLGA